MRLQRLTAPRLVQTQKARSSDGNNLLSTLVDLDQPAPRNKVALIAGLLFFLAIWIAFLTLLTISRVHRPRFIFDSIPNTYPWFDNRDAIFIIIPFLMPGLLIAFTAFGDWRSVRHRQQAYAVNRLLLKIDDELTPIIPISQADPFISSTRIYKNIGMLGWHVPGRQYGLSSVLMRCTLFVFSCGQALVALSSSYSPGMQLIDSISPLVAAILTSIVLAFEIVWLFRYRKLVRVRVDECGITLPKTHPRERSTPIPWHTIRALYRVAVWNSHGAYDWLMVIDDHIVGWTIASSRDSSQETLLAQAILSHTNLPLRNATYLCKRAVGVTSLVPAASETTYSDQQWQLALAEAQQIVTIPRHSYLPAIIWGIVGLAGGIAATVIIAQIAAQSIS